MIKAGAKVRVTRNGRRYAVTLRTDAEISSYTGNVSFIGVRPGKSAAWRYYSVRPANLTVITENGAGK